MSTIFCLDIKSTNRRLEKTRRLKYFMLRTEHEDMEIVKVGGYIFLLYTFRKLNGSIIQPALRGKMVPLFVSRSDE